jgi:hypothetical protein
MGAGGQPDRGVYGGEALSRYQVGCDPATGVGSVGRLRTVKSATLYETSCMPSQLRLFDLGEEGWVKFLKLEEYAARLPRRVYVTGGVRVLTLNLWGCRGRGTSAGPSWPTACAGSDADSVAFWRGRRSLEGTSVCYRDAWESARPGGGRPHVRADQPACGREQAPSTGAYGSTTSSCAATIPYTGPHSTSAPASAPSPNLSEACG